MKECPACNRCFSDEVENCPHDGQPIVLSLHGPPVLEDRYLLDERIGRGGMGIVYKARHVFLKSAHAIKVILPDLIGNSPGLITRFRQEAMIAGSIRHQNIVSVTDFGVVNGKTPFLVMDYIKGRSLHDILVDEIHLSPGRALEIITAIANGVGAAHRQGIVHRDLKPLNILIQDGLPLIEGVKVLDFGLAKVKTGELFGSFVAAQTTGMMGSPFYMAPEQWSEEEPDARADIYSLGIILYQMLAGDVPFKGPSLPAVMRQHMLHMPPTFGSLGTKVPPQIEAVVRHALEKDPDSRPGNLDEFVMELRDAVAAASISLDVTHVGKADPSAPNFYKEMAKHASGENGKFGAPLQEASAEDVLRFQEERKRATEAEEKKRRQRESEERASQIISQWHQRFEQEEQRLHLNQNEQDPFAAGVSESAERIARRRIEEADAARLRAEEEARRRIEEEARRKSEEETRLRIEEETRKRIEAETLRRLEEERARREEAPPTIYSDSFSSQPQSPGTQPTVAAPGPPAPHPAVPASATPPPPPTVVSRPAEPQQKPWSQPASYYAPPVETQPEKKPWVIIAISATVVIVLVLGGALLGMYINSGDGGGSAGSKEGEGAKTTTLEKNPKAVTVAMPGGTYMMGRKGVAVSDRNLSNQYPAHPVSVNAFYIDKTEVTNEEYGEFVRAQKYAPPSYWTGDRPPLDREQWPVTNVSYDDALAFAAWRSKRDGVTYRLPTEEEWEYAARSGHDDYLFPWGASWAAGYANIQNASPRPVASFSQGTSSQGVYDLIGNVWEWTSSRNTVYPGNTQFVVDEDKKDWLVVRGGSYKDNISDGITATTRPAAPADTRKEFLGFRLVRDNP
jgi:serine/threonine protein kinase/formylglycine-generating enzyme required for sulfatase activity